MKLIQLLLSKACTFHLVPCAIFLFSLFALPANAQNTIQVSDQEAAYNRTIQQRAEKIVAVLDINDAAKSARVGNIVAAQYKNLNRIYTTRDEKLKAIKLRSNDQQQAAEVNKVQDEVKRSIDILHKQYLDELAKELTSQQIDQIKDGMTYGVLHVTYKGYQDMIPTLTKEQKKQILTWLIEARELAMDAESSDKKHAWFGKYKGRINNYLSAAGYDLKKAGDEWQKRLKAEQDAKKSR